MLGLYFIWDFTDGMVKIINTIRSLLQRLRPIPGKISHRTCISPIPKPKARITVNASPEPKP